MNKVPFYLIIFLFTTGFFKSTIEKCADYHFKLSNSLPIAEYAEELKPASIYNEEMSEWKKTMAAFEKRNQRKKAEWERLKKLPHCQSWMWFESEKIRKKHCTKFHKDKAEYEGFSLFDFGPTPPSRTRTIVVRKFTKNEIERNYKKFIRQSLKTKLRLADESSREGKIYLDKYNQCVNSQKSNPQLFKDKYR